jgi:hypothetical protein
MDGAESGSTMAFVKASDADNANDGAFYISLCLMTGRGERELENSVIVSVTSSVNSPKAVQRGRSQKYRQLTVAPQALIRADRELR